MTAPLLHVRRLSATVHSATAGSATAGSATAGSATAGSATVHSAVGDGDRGRVDRMLRRLADRRLAEALRGVSLPPGQWCVRRIDVPIRLDPERPDGAVEFEWARALIAALQRALAQRSPDVVHYRNDQDALADLVVSVATGQLHRAWAWFLLGLLPADQPAPGQPPGATILAAFERRPERALAVLTEAVHRAGVPALDRALGAAGWAAVAALVRAAVTGWARPTVLAPADLPDPHLPDPHQSDPDRADPHLPDPDRADSHWADPHLPDPHRADSHWADSRRSDPELPATAVGRLAATLIRTSPLATELRRGRLRPAAATRAAWANLVVADADPAVLSRPTARAVVGAVADLIAPGAVVSPPAPVRPAGSAGSARSTAARPAGARTANTDGAASLKTATRAGPGTTGSAVSSTGSDVARTAGRADPATTTLPSAPAIGPTLPPATGDGQGPAVDLPASANAPPAWPTAWGGLPFLLAAAEAAGIPAQLVDDPVLAARPLRWVLHAIGCSLVPAADDDPAVLAFAGLGPTLRPPSAQGDPAGPDEQARIDELARRWAAVTADRLPDSGDADPADVVLRLANRSGHVVADPGWIDIHLRLDEVDVAVRRAGLDLDPGWVPWLGTVVRFVYG